MRRLRGKVAGSLQRVTGAERTLVARVIDRVVKVRNVAQLSVLLVRGRIRRAVRPQPLPALPKLRLVFIAGCPRSGTTWLNEAFSLHPEALGNAESHAWPDVVVPVTAHGRDSLRAWLPVLNKCDLALRRDWDIRLLRFIDRPGLLRLIADTVAVRDLSDHAAALHVVHGSFAGFVSASGRGDVTLVEKTPTHILHGHDILASFPDALLIEVVRDGRDVCVSLAHRVGPWVPSDRRTQIDLWRSHVSAGIALQSDARVQGRVNSVRYETMHAAPAREIERLLKFAGLSTDPELISRLVKETDFSTYPRTGDGHHRRRGQVGDWRGEFTPLDEQLFMSMAGDLLAELGYDPK